jgi:RHS repeat-associated protein
MGQTYTYNGFDTRVAKNGVTYHRDGTGVTAPLISDSGATYTPGVSERRNGVSTFQNAGLKDAAKQTDISGNVTATRKYDAYGMVIGATGTWKGPFGYSGSAGYQEDETGLQLLGHRYYDSSTGRFITRDPIKDGRNWYSYCENNPINAVDAEGLYRVIVITTGSGEGAHTILGLEFADGHIEWFGFYGDSEIRENDAPKEGDKMKGYAKELTKEQFFKLLKIIFAQLRDQNAGKNPSGKYHLQNKNCAAWVYEVLVEAGLIEDSDDMRGRMSPKTLGGNLPELGVPKVEIPKHWKVPRKSGGSSSGSSSGSSGGSSSGPECPENLQVRQVSNSTFVEKYWSQTNELERLRLNK